MNGGSEHGVVYWGEKNETASWTVGNTLATLAVNVIAPARSLAERHTAPANRRQGGARRGNYGFSHNTTCYR